MTNLMNCYLCNKEIDLDSTYDDTYPYRTLPMFEVYPWKKLKNVLIHHGCLFEWKFPYRENKDKK